MKPAVISKARLYVLVPVRALNSTVLGDSKSGADLLTQPIYTGT